MILEKITLLAVALSMAIATADAQSNYRSTQKVKDRKNTNINGVVECDGNAVAGVVVSDGYETTVTDKNGRYWLNSRKLNPQIFISVPSGYEAVSDDVVPGFWADITSGVDKTERHDFNLTKTDNRRHAMIVFTDPHFCNTRNDISTFTETCMPVINNVVSKMRNDSITVYSMNLGDASWDRLWYENDFNIADFRKLLNDIDYPTPLYNVMGNHDNDGATTPGDSTDFNAARPYMKAFGPRYYSFNIGGIHYIVLDNIVYKNEGQPRFGGKGLAGSCNYDKAITDEQLRWLENDLAHVDYSTPLVIAAHIPFFKSKNGLGKKYTPNLENTDRLMEILKGHDEVHFLTGHTHYNTFCRISDSPNKVVEHNIAGTCGAWWYTSAAGYGIICPDGRPGGFTVFNAEDRNLSWDFIAYDAPDEKFNTIDINSVKEFYDNSGELKIFRKHYPRWSDYSDEPDNQVYINVWAWEPGWKVSVTENGKELPVEHLSLESPNYATTYMLWKTVWIEQYPESYAKPRKEAMFRTVASAKDTPLEITVTDSFGNEYRQSMIRPKKFSPAIK